MNFKWGFFAAAGALLLSLITGFISGVNLPVIILRAALFAVLFFALAAGVYVLLHSFFPELLEAAGEDDDAGFSPAGSNVDITVDSENFAVPEKFARGGHAPQMGDIGELLSRARGEFPQGAFAGSEGAAFKRALDQGAEGGYNNHEPQRDADGMIDLGDIEMSPLKKAPAGGQAAEEEGGSPGGASKEGSPAKERAFVPTFVPGADFSGGGDSSGGQAKKPPREFEAAVTQGGDLDGLPDLESMSGSFGQGFSSPSSESHEGAGREAEPAAKKSGGGIDASKFSSEELAKGIRTALAKDKS